VFYRGQGDCKFFYLLKKYFCLQANCTFYAKKKKKKKINKEKKMQKKNIIK